jgi:hypothetical protein
MQHTEGEEVRTLEYSTDGQDLQLCLAKLLEDGLVARFIERSAHSVSPGSYTVCPDFTRINMPYDNPDSYMPPHQNLLNGNIVQMFDDDTWSLENPFGSTTSTLINAEGVSKVPLPSMGSPFEFKEKVGDILHEEAPMLAGSDITFDDDVDPMDFISFEPAMDSLSSSLYTGGYESFAMLLDSPTIKSSPAGTAIMSSIPSSYADTNIDVHNFPPPANGTISPTKTVYISSTLHPSESYEIDHLSPPYNATPRLPAWQSHKRSLSGRILQKLM